MSIEKLMEGTELSKEAQDKVSELFESALSEKEEVIRAETEAKYEKLAEQYGEYVKAEMESKADDYISEEVVPMIEKYMDYATQEFMKENEIAVESGVKVELAESFLGGLSSIAEKFNVEVPAGKDDYLTEMEGKVEDMQKRFDAVLEEKNSLEASIIEGKKEKIIESKASDLTESQKEEFVGVAEKVSFHSDEQFERAVEDLYESYFPAGKSEESDSITEKLDEKQEQDEPKVKSWADELLARV